MKNILLISGVLLLMACGDTDNSASTTGDTPHKNANDTIVATEPVVLAGCYQMTMKRDSGWLNLTVDDTIVTGTLNYNLYEKDSNAGNIKGVVRDNMIYADYTFQSEGMTSVREVIFKLSDDTLIQAFGELAEKNGKIVFSDINNLQYINSSPFIKSNCR